MKKFGKIACLAAVLVMCAASVAFAATPLKVTSTYPTDGQKNTTKENMAVQVNFNKEVGKKSYRSANSECFQIVDESGKEVPIKVFYNPKNPKQALVLADTTKKLNIQDGKDYTLKISGDFVDNEGVALGTDETVTFTVINQKRGTAVYMVMMVLMFGAIFFFSAKQMKTSQKEKLIEEGELKEEPFNPYKEAKKTGKSVEELIAEHEKEMAKRRKRQEKKAKKNANAQPEEEGEEYFAYRVKGPRPIAAAGSKFITGRKAQHEAELAKKAEEEALKAKYAAIQAKQKSGKKKKK